MLTINKLIPQGRGLAGVLLRRAVTVALDWDLRQKPELKAAAVANRAMGTFTKIRGAMVFAFPPPAVTELGVATGFDLMLQDRSGLGHEKLSQIEGQLLGMAAQDPRLARVRPNGMADVAQYKVDIDWERAGALGLSVSSIQSYVAGGFGRGFKNGSW